jgi:hypothetical protein
MQSMQLLIYILFGAVLFGGGGALLYLMPSGKETPPAAQDRMASVEPQKQQETAQDNKAGEQTTPATGPGAPVSPSFDVVRIQKDGEGVIAGRAEPGWTVIVESNEREVARTTADQFGEWTVLLEKPLPPGEHSIGLRALSKGAALGRASEQHVSISIAGEKSEEQTVVALSKPGEPTKVLTSKEPAPEAQRAAREPAAEAKPETAAQPAEQKPESAVQQEEKPAELASKKEEEPKPAPAAPVSEVAVSFSAVDYEVAGDGSGQLFLSGDAASGARVQLYLNNKRLGSTVAGPDGSWTFRSASKLSPKTEHTMRADAVQSDGQVTSRAEVEFTPPDIPQPETQVAAKEEEPRPSAPAEKKPEAVQPDKPVQATPPAETARPEPPVAAPGKPEVAAAPETEKKSGPAAKPEPKREESVAAAREPKPEPAPTGEKPQAPMASESSRQAAPSSRSAQQPAPEPAQPAEPAPSSVASADREPQAQADPGQQAVLNQKRSIVVRRGDTLWHIAERRYGSGTRYTAIYRDNRDQIRNPHWIYPGQEFSLPSN